MKRFAFLFIALLFGGAQARAFSTEHEQTAEIAILDGTVVVELAAGGDDFYCIGIRLSDSSINSGVGTCMEIKWRGADYLLDEGGKRYASVDATVEDFLEDLFKRFYDERKQGKKVWKAFVKEGGLRLSLVFAGEIVDEESLSSPFNEI